jgi:hypothetical protein
MVVCFDNRAEPMTATYLQNGALVAYFTTPDYIATIGRLMGKQWIGKDLEGSNRDPVEVLLLNCPGGTEKTMKNFSQDIQCLGRDSNPAPPDYNTTALPAH